jgi:hypothetical protein
MTNSLKHQEVVDLIDEYISNSINIEEFVSELIWAGTEVPENEWTQKTIEKYKNIFVEFGFVGDDIPSKFSEFELNYKINQLSKILRESAEVSDYLATSKDLSTNCNNFSDFLNLFDLHVNGLYTKDSLIQELNLQITDPDILEKLKNIMNETEKAYYASPSDPEGETKEQERISDGILADGARKAAELLNIEFTD